MRIASRGFGCRVAIDVPGDRLADLRRALPYWWHDAVVEPELVWVVNPADTVGAVVGALELWVAEHAPQVVFVHAGMVAVGGRAMLLPGRSMSGKSTLVAALLRAGADYGSDEYALLRPDGYTLGYPRPLSLRGPDGHARPVPAAEFGSAVVGGAVRVAAIADVRYDRDGAARLEALSPAQGALRLFDNAVAATSDPERVLTAVTAAAETARCVAGVRSEADIVSSALLALLDGNEQR